MASFFLKIYNSTEEYEAFKKSLKQLFEEEVIVAIIQSVIQDYKDALQEANLEKLNYTFARDIIQIVSTIVGIYQLAKGVSSFVSLVRK